MLTNLQSQNLVHINKTETALIQYEGCFWFSAEVSKAISKEKATLLCFS